MPSTRKPLGSTILLYYDTTTYTHIHLQSFKLGHAHERRCVPNLREQHGGARHEAQQHDGAQVLFIDASMNWRKD